LQVRVMGTSFLDHMEPEGTSCVYPECESAGPGSELAHGPTGDSLPDGPMHGFVTIHKTKRYGPRVALGRTWARQV